MYKMLTNEFNYLKKEIQKYENKIEENKNIRRQLYQEYQKTKQKNPLHQSNIDELNKLNAEYKILIKKINAVNKMLQAYFNETKIINHKLL